MPDEQVHSLFGECCWELLRAETQRVDQKGYFSSVFIKLKLAIGVRRSLQDPLCRARPPPDGPDLLVLM